jgi:hypothetical protein|tara:strand:- start:467 stop:907 length:441 start_codon:yes stop_codon:yes gene_type:complete
VIFLIKYIGLLLLLIFPSPVFANEQDIFHQLEDLKESYGANFKEIPSHLKTLFGSERVNIQVNGEVIGVIINEGDAIELINGGVDDPTIKLTIDEKQIENILASSDPMNKFIDAFINNEIQTETYDFFSKIKVFIAKIVTTLTGLL